MLLPIIIFGSFLLIPATVAGIVLSAHSSFVSSGASSKSQPTPDAPVAILPSAQKTPEQSIPALSTTTTPTIVVKPQPVVTTTPSSSVSSLKPTSTTTSSSSSSTSPSTSTSTTTVTSGYSSTNWSGYMATTGSFSAVSGSWVVPQATATGSSTSGDAAWIGVGGVTASDLIQVGTDTTVSATTGKASTSIFYEMLPAAANIVTTIPISAGDAIHASLSGSGSQWTISIMDVTTGQSFTQTVSYASSLSSAEWIEEDPSYANGQLMPLDNFGTITFSGATTTIGGVSTSLAGAKSQPITLVDGSGNVIASPSTITSDGMGFSVTHS